MSFLTKIFGGGVSEVIGAVGGVVDKFVTTGDEKHKMKMELEQVITQQLAITEASFVAEVNAKAEVMKAELLQGDNYTKRMRPTLGYLGMLFFLIDVIQQAVQIWAYGITVPVALKINPEFTIAWAGMMSIYFIGRSMEKRGTNGKAGDLAGKITGSTPLFGK